MRASDLAFERGPTFPRPLATGSRWPVPELTSSGDAGEEGAEL